MKNSRRAGNWAIDSRRFHPHLPPPTESGALPEGAKKQSCVSDEGLVIVRDADAETRALLEGCEFATSTLQVVPVRGPGTVAALNAGLEATRASIIAIIDDDTVTRPDWLARINTHFRADPKVEGVGGRDWIHHDGKVEDVREKWWAACSGLAVRSGTTI
jgi:cellulose synthase/poly-beta-1,6-N-acetylglucosamine synthase-like glycosyltransferase